MKKILYVTHYSDMLGANRSLLNVVLSLNAIDEYQPIVIVPRNGAFTNYLKENNIQYIVMYFCSSAYEKRKFYDNIKGLFKELINILVSIRLYVILRKYNISIIHSNSSVVDIGVYLSMFLKVPHIWHIREFAKEHYHYNYNFGYKYQYYLFKHHSKKIIAISQSILNYYTNLLNKKIDLVYNGVSLDNEYIRKESSNNINIVSVGVLHPSKHQDIIIEAINILVNSYKVNNIHLHFYGGGSNNQLYENNLFSKVKNDNLEKIVTFHGYSNNVYDEIYNYDIGILASEYEAFGRVTIEYMLLGLVPIVSNSGANSEIIIENKTGYLFELNNSKDLAEKIYYLITNKEKMNNISTIAKKEAETKYSIQKNIEAIINIYKELLSKKDV